MTYIDVGCHSGETIVDFIGSRFHGFFPKGVEIIGIDPLTDYLRQMDQLRKSHNVRFINQVAWIKTGVVLLSECGILNMGTTIMKDKLNYDDKKMRPCECFDFSNFLKDFPEVIIRMDIEGAEYEVLEKMIADGTISNVKFLEIEWHASKMNGDWLQREQRLKEQLKFLNINYVDVG